MKKEWMRKITGKHCATVWEPPPHQRWKSELQKGRGYPLGDAAFAALEFDFPSPRSTFLEKINFMVEICIAAEFVGNCDKTPPFDVRVLPERVSALVVWTQLRGVRV